MRLASCLFGFALLFVDAEPLARIRTGDTSSVDLNASELYFQLWHGSGFVQLKQIKDHPQGAFSVELVKDQEYVISPRCAADIEQERLGHGVDGEGPKGAPFFSDTAAPFPDQFRRCGHLDSRFEATPVFADETETPGPPVLAGFTFQVIESPQIDVHELLGRDDFHQKGGSPWLVVQRAVSAAQHKFATSDVPELALLSAANARHAEDSHRSVFPFTRQAVLLNRIVQGRVPKAEIELVITRFDEDIAWSDLFSSIRTVYNNGPELVLHSGDQPIPHENTGLGDRVIADHFYNRYDDLAEHTTFTQAGHPGFGYRQETDYSHLCSSMCLLDYVASQEDFYAIETEQVSGDLKLHRRRSTWMTEQFIPSPETSRTTKDTTFHAALGFSVDFWGDWVPGYFPMVMDSFQDHAKRPLNDGLTFEAFWSRFVEASGWAPLSPDTRVSYAQGSNMQVSRDQVRKQPRGFWKDLGGVLVEEIRPKEGIFAEITWRYLITSPEDEQDQADLKPDIEIEKEQLRSLAKLKNENKAVDYRRDSRLEYWNRGEAFDGMEEIDQALSEQATPQTVESRKLLQYPTYYPTYSPPPTRSPTIIASTKAPTTTKTPTAEPTSPPTAAPVAVIAPVPGCANNFTLDETNAQLAYSESVMCAVNDSSLLPPLPVTETPADGSPPNVVVLSPVVNVTLVGDDGNKVIVTELTPVSFNIPFLPGTDVSSYFTDGNSALGAGGYDPATRVQRQGTGCQQEEFRCEWWNGLANAWVADGCKVGGISAAGAQCVCNHLTVFMLALRSFRSLDPVCAGNSSLYWLAACYALLLLTCIVQTLRLRAYTMWVNLSGTRNAALGARRTRKCTDLFSSPITFQLMGIALAALLRALTLVISNGLAVTSPALLVLAASVPCFLELCIFSYLITGWLKVGAFAMNLGSQNTVGRIAKAIVFISFVVTFTFPALLMSVSLESQQFQDLTLYSAYSSAAMSGLLAISVLLVGCKLVSALENSSKLSMSSTGKRHLSQTTLVRRLTTVWCVCFFVQAVFLVLAVQTNHLLDETSNVVVPTVYYVSDLLSLVVLLIMISRSVGKFAAKAKESSRKFSEQVSFKSSKTGNTMQTTNTLEQRRGSVEMEMGRNRNTSDSVDSVDSREGLFHRVSA